MDNRNTKTHGTPFFNQLLEDFKEWLERLGYAGSTVKGHEKKLKRFFNYQETSGRTTLESIDSKAIKGYEDYLDKLAICSVTICHNLSVLRRFDEYLEKYGYEPILKTALRIIPDLQTPKIIVTKQEIKKLYAITAADMQGYRDRAMLALYYGCGLRAKEGLELELKDLDFKSGLVQVRKSKTGYQRYVPMNEKVGEDLKDWLEYGRKLMLKTESPMVLIHRKGGYKNATGFNARLKKLLKETSINLSLIHI